MISTEDLAWKELITLREIRKKPYEPDRTIKIPSVDELKKLKVALTKEQKELLTHIDGIEEGIKNIETEIEGLNAKLATSGKTFKDAIKQPEIEKAIELSKKKLGSAKSLLEDNKECLKGLEDRLETIDDEIAREEEYQIEYAEVEERWREKLTGYDELTFRAVIKEIAPIENTLLELMEVQEKYYALTQTLKDAKYPNFKFDSSGRWDKLSPNGMMILVENGRIVKKLYEPAKQPIEIRTETAVN